MIRKLLSRVFKFPSRRVRPRVIPFTQHGVRREGISPAALKVITRLQESGFAAFVVGGAVRDLLLDQHPKDFDVATNATPEQVHHAFRRSRIIGRRFRIVHVMVGAETVEVTTFRGGEDSVTDSEGRILNDNVFGSQEEDARRRDFTVNALFYNPSDETIIDYHHGVRDVHARKLAMIGNPVQRYREDPVRMLRAVRLAAKLGLRIDEPTRKPIAELAPLLQNVPAARLFDEMLKMLFSGHAYDCVQMLRQEGLHQGIFPLLDMIAESSSGASFVQLALENSSEKPDIIYLTGGSARSPLIKNALAEQLPGIPIAGGDDFGSVTAGLARWAQVVFRYPQPTPAAQQVCPDRGAADRLVPADGRAAAIERLQFLAGADGVPAG